MKNELPLEGRAPGEPTAEQSPPRRTEGMLALSAEQFCQAAGIRVEHRGGFLVDTTGMKKRTRPEWQELYQAYLCRPVG